MPKCNKEEMARQAAAKYSTNLLASVYEYCRLIGLECSVELQDEMLALLPLYRHPTPNENLIFFGRISCNAMGYTDPPFLKRIQKYKDSTDLYNTIEEYVKEAEHNKIELAGCRHKLQEIEALLDNAKKIYQENDGRADRRNSKVVQALGFSKGVPQKRIDYMQVYKDYFICVRKEGKSREEALTQIQKKHGFSSCDTTIKALYKAREDVFAAWAQLCPNSSLEIKKHLKGFIPSRR